MRLEITLGLPLAILALATAPLQAADTPPLSVLKEKGLSKSGTTYVIEAEQPVLQKMKEVKAVVDVYAKLAERQAAEEQVATHLAGLEQSRVELHGHLTDLNQRIIEQGTMQPNNGPRPGSNGPSQASQLIAQRDQTKMALAEVTMEQKTLKVQSTPAKDNSAIDEELKKRGEATRAALAELRTMVDDVAKKYADLEKDASIKKAKADFQKSTKAVLKLGPSDAFKSGAKALDQAERQLFGKKTANVSRKKAKSKK